MITRLAQFTDVRAALVVGGLSLQVQAATLRTHPEVVVATPVRLAQGSRVVVRSPLGSQSLQMLAPMPVAAAWGGCAHDGACDNGCRGQV